MPDLITLAEVKVHLKIDQTDATNDARLKQLIPQISGLVVSYCRQDFQEIGRQEFFDSDTDAVFLRERPIASLTSVIAHGTTLAEGTDFVLYKNTGELRSISGFFGPGFRPAFNLAGQTYRRSLEVNYVGGIDGPPEEVKLATLEWLAILSGLKTKTFSNNQGIEGTVTLTNLPDDIKGLLKRWRRERINHLF